MRTILPLVMWLIILLNGVMYVVFAFREPPESVKGWIRIPGIFIFVPEEYRVKAGRLATGAALLLFSLSAFYYSLAY